MWYRSRGSRPLTNCGGNSIHMPSFRKERLSAGVAEAIAILKQFGLLLLAAAKAAYDVIHGSDHVERRMQQQEAAWSAAIDTVPYDCQQAALGHKAGRQKKPGLTAAKLEGLSERELVQLR